MTSDSAGAKRKEIYTYTAPWLIYGMNWSVRADQRFRLAIGSFEEEYSNSVRVIQLDEETHKFVDIGGFEHPYPTTKIMWMPDPNGSRRDLLATTGDYLRLWQVTDNKSIRLECLLNNVRFCPCPDAGPVSSLTAAAVVWHFPAQTTRLPLPPLPPSSERGPRQLLPPTSTYLSDLPPACLRPGLPPHLPHSHPPTLPPPHLPTTPDHLLPCLPCGARILPFPSVRAE